VPRRIVIPVIASLALIVGFIVAQGSGQRWLGGVVLVAAAIWCSLQWRALAGSPRAVLAVGVYAVALAVSHPLSGVIGAWPSVAAVSVAAAVISYSVTGRRRHV
jgi:hypothetical protein